MTSKPGGFPIWEEKTTGVTSASVEVELTPEELVDCFVYQALHRAPLRRVRWRSIVRLLPSSLLLYGSLAIAIALFERPDDPHFKTPLVVALLYWAFVAAMAIAGMCLRKDHGRRALRANYRVLARDPSYRRLLGPYRLHLSPEGVRQSSAGIESHVQWSWVENIFADSRVLYVSIGAAGTFIAPRRAFPDEQSYWGFVRLARTYREGAKSSA